MIQNTYDNTRLSGWMLTLSLILFTISFSGYTGNRQSIQKQATQTHLVDSNCNKASTRVISYSKALALIGTNGFLNTIYSNWTNYIFHYNSRIEIEISTNSYLFFCTNTKDRSSQIKVILQCSDKDSSPA